jgi:hypothetical protein
VSPDLVAKGVPAFAESEVSAAVDALHGPEDGDEALDVPDDSATVRDLPPFEEGLDDEPPPLHRQPGRVGGPGVIDMELL